MLFLVLILVRMSSGRSLQLLNLSLGDVMFVSIKNYICKNFVCRMCVRWWVYVSETRFCFSCEVLPVCFVVVSVGLTVLL